jgi:hypothetical protein
MWIAIAIVAAWMFIFCFTFTRAIRQWQVNKREWAANLKEWEEQDQARRARFQQ